MFVSITLIFAFCLLTESDLAIKRAKSYVSPDLKISEASVIYHQDLDLLVFSQKVEGHAGGTIPEKNGQLNGAPVLGYVFPTSLKPSDVGFATEEGMVALAVTSHPDFDDTPLWDENGDHDYGNDGVFWHTHWVVLESNKKVPGGLAVVQIRKETMAKVLPPTNPGMPMLMDSPGFSVLKRGNTLKILVPRMRMGGKRTFKFDAVTVYMQVNTSNDLPLLGVYHVYSILSGDLSLPFSVK